MCGEAGRARWCTSWCLGNTNGADICGAQRDGWRAVCSMSHIYECENAETEQAGRRATHVHDRIPVLDYFLFLQRDADEKSGGDGGGDTSVSSFFT